MTAPIELSTKAAVKINVNTVSGGASGGGVSAHSALTGLTTGDDHPQYQRSESFFTSAASYTVTDQSTVITTGTAVVLPDAADMAGRQIVVGAAASDVSVSPAGTDSMWDNPGSPYTIPLHNAVSFTSLQISGGWGWAIATRNGPAFDTPAWYGLALAAGKVLRIDGTGAPAWANIDAADVPSLAASKITSGTFDVARLATGTASSSVFLRGDGTWATATDSGAAQKASNLSDLASASTARTNLGLGGAATLSVGTTTGTVAAGNDSRLSDTRTPTDGSVSTAKIVDSAVTSAKIADGTIVNADISASAAISASKISGLTTVATDVIFDAAGDLPVGTGADASARLAKGTRTQALVVGASTLEWDANHYNGGNYVTATVTGAIAETIPGGAGFGAVNVGSSGQAHLHGIYLPKGVTITTISVVSGATSATTPTNQWFALCDSSRTVLRVTANDTTAAWNPSTVKPLALTSTFTTTYSGLHYIAICVTATTVPSFRGSNAGTSTGIATQNFTSTTGLTTPVAEGTTFAAAVARVSQVFGVVS